MATVDLHLLAADPTQACASPAALLAMRTQQLDCASFLKLLTDDLAAGMSLETTADDLAARGALSTARELWLAAGFTVEQIEQRSTEVRRSWQQQIDVEANGLREFTRQHKGTLSTDQRQNVDGVLRLAAEHARADRFDLALTQIKSAQELVLSTLDEAQRREAERHRHLALEVEAAKRRVLEGVRTWSDGVREQLAQELITKIEDELRQPSFDEAVVRHLLSLAASLTEGDYDETAILAVLGKAAPKSRVQSAHSTSSASALRREATEGSAISVPQEVQKPPARKPDPHVDSLRTIPNVAGDQVAPAVDKSVSEAASLDERLDAFFGDSASEPERPKRSNARGFGRKSAYTPRRIDTGRQHLSPALPAGEGRSSQPPLSPMEPTVPPPETPPQFIHTPLIEVDVAPQAIAWEERRDRSEKAHNEAKRLRRERRSVEAEGYFKQALQLWPGNEAAAKNYATLLKERNRAKDAIEVLEQGLQYARMRLPFYNLLSNYCSDAGDQVKAREYALTALQLAGDATSEIGVLDSLITLETRDGNLRQAIEYCDAVLRLDPQKEYYRKKRAKLFAQVSGQESGTPDLTSEPQPEFFIDLDIEVSPLLQEDLKNCELTKVQPHALITTDRERILQEVDRLQGEGARSNPGQPRERADYFLQAAKMAMRTLQSAAENGSRSKPLQDSLNAYTGAMGDYFLQRGMIDSARAYFLEYARIHNRRIFGFAMHRIANYFQTFALHEGHLVELVSQGGAGLNARTVTGALRKVLNSVPDEDRVELAQGVVEIAAMNSLIYKYIHEELAAKEDLAAQFHGLFGRLERLYGTDATHVLTSDAFQQLVQHRRFSRERQEDLLRRIRDDVLSNRVRLPEALDLLANLATSQAEWCTTDRRFFESVRQIGAQAQRYFDESRFEDKDYLAGTVTDGAERFVKDLDMSPTYLGRAYFSSIVYRFRRLVEEEHRKLRLVSLPDLVAEIVSSRWQEPERVRECHIQIANAGESAAQEVKVRILPSDVGDYEDDDRLYPVPNRSIYPRPHTATVAIPVSVRPSAAEKEAVDLQIQLEYYDRESHPKKTDPARLRLPLQDEVAFVPFDNPYVVGPPVTEPGLFVGRDDFVASLIRDLNHPDRTSAVLMFGQKRSGKTSVLKRLELDTPETAIPVYLSLHDILYEDDPLRMMLYYIAMDILDKHEERGIHLDVDAPDFLDVSSPTAAFKIFLMQVRRRAKKRLVLLIDEFTELAALIEMGRVDPAIMKYLKSLIEQGYFSCVIAGSDSMVDVIKRYPNELAVFRQMYLGYLDEQSAADLIEKPILLPDGRTRFTSRQVVNEIINLTAGSPFYLQHVCYRLAAYLKTEHTPTVTGADVDRVLTDAIQGKNRLDRGQFDNLCRYAGDDAQDTRETVIEGLFLYLLADETKSRPLAPFTAISERIRSRSVSEEEILAIADSLEARRVIERAPGDLRQYKIVVDLFKRWLNANRPVDSQLLSAFNAKLERSAA